MQVGRQTAINNPPPPPPENKAWLFIGQNFRCAVSVVLKALVKVIARTDTNAVHYLYHTGLAAIENANTIDARRSNIDRNSFLLSFVARLAIENTVSCDFYPRSSIVKSVFDCHRSGVFIIAPACFRTLCNVAQYTDL